MGVFDWIDDKLGDSQIYLGGVIYYYEIRPHLIHRSVCSMVDMSRLLSPARTPLACPTCSLAPITSSSLCCSSALRSSAKPSQSPVKYSRMRGVSIWSLTTEFPLGHFNRGVTIEVRKDGAIVQCRGFANRLPYGNEVAVVKRWANEHGLRWAAIER